VVPSSPAGGWPRSSLFRRAVLGGPADGAHGGQHRLWAPRPGSGLLGPGGHAAGSTFHAIVVNPYAFSRSSGVVPQEPMVRRSPQNLTAHECGAWLQKMRRTMETARFARIDGCL
jgi:hypothetical protein